MLDRTCSGISKGGERCRQAPLRDQAFCFWHHPDNAEAADQARKLGGQRRRREGTLLGAYDFEGLATVAELRRLLEIATLDTLSLENSVARNRTLMTGVQTAAKLLEVGELEDRVASLEAALSSRAVTPTRRR